MKYTHKLCLVIPCLYQDFDSGILQLMLKRLTDNTNKRCKYSVDLHLYFNNINSNYNELYSVEEHPSINKLFIHNLKIPPQEDVYLKPWENPEIPQQIPALGLSSGPNISFYQSMYKTLNDEVFYSNIFLLETDVYFLSENWLDYSIDFCIDNEFLIAGSIYKGANPSHENTNYANHLNGVAIYKNSNTLLELLQHSETSIKECIHNDSHTFYNFDIAIFNSVNTLSLNSQYKNVDFITNMADTEFDCFLSLFDCLEMHPKTKVLHRKPFIKKKTTQPNNLDLFYFTQHNNTLLNKLEESLKIYCNTFSNHSALNLNSLDFHSNINSPIVQSQLSFLFLDVWLIDVPEYVMFSEGSIIFKQTLKPSYFFTENKINVKQTPIHDVCQNSEPLFHFSIDFANQLLNTEINFYYSESDLLVVPTSILKHFRKFLFTQTQNKFLDIAATQENLYINNLFHNYCFKYHNNLFKYFDSSNNEFNPRDYYDKYFSWSENNELLKDNYFN